MKTISSKDSVVTTRDLDKRVDELQEELDYLVQDLEDAEEALADCKTQLEDAKDMLTESGNDDPDYCINLKTADLQEAETALEAAEAALSEWNEEYAAPLAELKTVLKEFEGYGDTGINESYWEEYADDQIREAIEGHSQSWPFSCIDWEEARQELQSDYSAVEWEGTTFYVM